MRIIKNIFPEILLGIISISIIIMSAHYCMLSTDSLHFGLMLSNAASLGNGLVPHQDFTIQYGVATTFFQMIFCKLFGFSYLSLGISTAIFFCLHIFVVFKFLAQEIEKVTAFFITIFIFMVSILADIPWSDYYSGFFLSLAFYLVYKNRIILTAISLLMCILCRYTYMLPVMSFLFFYPFIFKRNTRKLYISFLLISLTLFLLMKLIYTFDSLQILKSYYLTVVRHSGVYNPGNNTKIDLLIGFLKKCFDFRIERNYFYYLGVITFFYTFKRKPEHFKKHLFIFLVALSNSYYLVTYDYELFRWLNALTIYEGFVIIVYILYFKEAIKEISFKSRIFNKTNLIVFLKVILNPATIILLFIIKTNLILAQVSVNNFSSLDTYLSFLSNPKKELFEVGAVQIHKNNSLERYINLHQYICKENTIILDYGTENYTLGASCGKKTRVLNLVRGEFTNDLLSTNDLKKYSKFENIFILHLDKNSIFGKENFGKLEYKEFHLPRVLPFGDQNCIVYQYKFKTN